MRWACNRFVGAVGCSQLSRNLKVSMFVQTDKIKFVDGLAGSRQKNIKDRQRAVDRPLMQLGSSSFG